MKTSMQDLGALHGENAPALPCPDVAGLVYSAASMFDPLRSEHLVDFQVSQVKDGYVFLTVALPEGITRPFIGMLDSMIHFMRFLDQKTKIVKAEEKAKTVDLKEQERRKLANDLFNKKVCKLFDGFRESGHSVPESIKLTNSALKAKNEPWAKYTIVESILRAQGRFRRTGYKTQKRG